MCERVCEVTCESDWETRRESFSLVELSVT